MCGFGGAVPLHEKPGPVAVLRHRPRGAPVPDQRGDDVASRAKVRRDVEGLVTPVLDVGALRSGRDLLAVDVQSIPVVRADVDDEARRYRGQLEGSPRME